MARQSQPPVSPGEYLKDSVFVAPYSPYYSHPPTHYDYKYASTGGLPVADTQVKVLSIDDGRELGPNETGEVCAKGPQIVMGYLNNEAATRETFVDGWLRTGDVGHIDDEGLIHIEDRIKEMIKVRGLQVPPAELEDLLLGHPDVEDAAVTSVPDDYSGEKSVHNNPSQ